jgi:hypothetical protein
VTFTDPQTGIIFNSWGIPADSPQTQGGFTFGMALPSNALSTDATEFIGYLVRYSWTRVPVQIEDANYLLAMCRRLGRLVRSLPGRTDDQFASHYRMAE